MNFFRRGLHFPLLAKELSEMAARRRTYAVRVSYALLLYLIFFLGPYRAMVGPNGGYYSSWVYNLGFGRELFHSLVEMQFIGLYVFLPAIMCGAITQEKERDSLVLLFLTDLRPWEIILQKYLSGLVSMMSFLLLSIPLVAICYTFGGVSTPELTAGIAMLFLGCLQAGALVLMCSTYCRSTAAAFVASYLAGGLLYLGPPLAVYAMHSLNHASSNGEDWMIATSLVPRCAFADFRGGGIPALPLFLKRCGVIALSTLLFLGAARYFLKRRAFSPPNQWLLKVFRAIDRGVNRANRLVGGVRVVREADPFPERNPVRWREVTKKPLGQARYIVRIGLAVEAVAILVALTGVNLSAILVSLWCVAFVVLGAMGANAIVSERVQQTLEVLLTTPISGREILLEKVEALRRFTAVFFVPMATIISVEAWMHSWSQWRSVEETMEIDMVCAFLSVILFLPLISWVSLWVGMRMRTRFRAILTVLVIFVVWCAIPPIMRLFVTHDFPGWPLQWSPAMLVALQQSHELGDLFHPKTPFFAGDLWIDLLRTFSVYGVILFVVRWHCLRHADRYLRRSFAA